MKDIKKSELVLLLLLLTVSGYALRSSSLFFEDLITDKAFRKSITETGQELITVTLKKVLETDTVGKESKGKLEIYKSVVDQAEKNGSLDEIKEVLEKKVKEGKASPQILFTLAMVYERKGMKREAYKTLEKVEKAVKQQPKIAFNLSLVYGRKKTLKSQIDKAEAEAFTLTHGSVDVKSFPEGVEVYLNGDKKCKTPLTLSEMEAGEYKITLKKDGYEDKNISVTVNPGKTAVIDTRLTESASKGKSVDKVVENWAAGLKDKNIDQLMETYWPDAVFTFIPPNGDSMVLNGSDEIRSGQEGGFVNRPEINILVDTAEHSKTGSTITYTINVESSDVVLINTLELEQRDNEWRIINQTVRIQ